MGVALQVLLMVGAIVVAVAGIGIALALRFSARQRSGPRRADVMAETVPMQRRAPARHGARESTRGATRDAAGEAVRSPARESARNAAHAPAHDPVREAHASLAAAQPHRHRASPASALQLTPEQAHRAKLVALQALLAAGDAKAAQRQPPDYADTQAFNDDYPPTQFGDDMGASPPPVSLLNLDAAAPRPARR